MTGVLTALGNRWDSQVATLLEASRDASLVRRCADLPDLLAAAAAGLGSVALVSEELRGLDLTAVTQLHRAGLHVVGIAAAGDEEAERRLRRIGITRVVPGGADRMQLEAALTDWPEPPAPEAGGTVDGTGAQVALGGGDRLDREAEEGLGLREPRAARPDHPGLGSAAADPVPGRVVAVWGPTGAPGRTTIAVALASELAVLGVPTVLVDADTYGGSVAQALSFLDEAPGIAAATRAADQGTLDVPSLARLAPVATAGMRVLGGIPKSERWPEIRAAALERVLTVSRQLAHVVVVDCGFNLEDDEELSYDTVAPRRNAATLTALGAADEVVAVGAGDPVGLQRLVRGLQELRATTTLRPTVVVNKVRAAAVGSDPERRVAEVLSRFAGLEEVLFVPDDRPSLDVALLQGRTLAECAPQSPIRPAVRALAARVAVVPEASRPLARRRLLHRRPVVTR